MTLLENIDRLCRKNGISRRKLSIECGLDPSSIQKWGRSEPGYSNLKKVADYFGVTTDYLLGVQKNGQEEVYYLNQETALKAQRAYEKYGILFDAAEGCKPEDIQMAVDLLNRLKETNIDG